MTAAGATVITTPGLYEDLPEHVYHADPVPDGSLSSTGARKILPPGCPALFAYEREHGRADTRAFDVGHAAHSLVLGVGAEIVAVDADDWRTKAAKESAAAARTEGKTPLLAREYEQVQGMAAALREHPIAAALLAPGSGRPEVSAFWIDTRADVMLRARYDWLPHTRPDGRLIIPDYKTSHSANPDSFAKSAADYGYHQQDAFYTDCARALKLGQSISFVFIVQQKTPPYLVTVCELDSVAKRIGRARNREAIDLYAHCQRTDTWPPYTDDVALVSLPNWYERRNQEGSA